MNEFFDAIENDNLKEKGFPDKDFTMKGKSMHGYGMSKAGIIVFSRYISKL